MNYNIKYMTSPDWDKADTAAISAYVWGGEYTPRAVAKLISTGDSLHARLECEEANPKAEYRNFFDPVYLDSCLEFFFSFQKGGKYVNCEMNSLGTSLIAVGDDRHGRVRIDKIAAVPAVKASREGNIWRVEAEFTLEKIGRAHV